MLAVVGGVHQKWQWHIKDFANLVRVGCQWRVACNECHYWRYAKACASCISWQGAQHGGRCWRKTNFFMGFAQCSGSGAGVVRIDFSTRKGDLPRVYVQVWLALG